MFNHEPENYKCPFCAIVNGEEGEFPHTKQSDIFYQDEYIVAFIASHWWKNNHGHVIVIPKNHVENIYDLPIELNARIHDFSRFLAIALKRTYKCDGVSTRQHNEPSGDQDVWHYHLHVFPRYIDDNLYILSSTKNLSQPRDRVQYAIKLTKWFNDNPYQYRYKLT